jgi:hypothetical protein
LIEIRACDLEALERDAKRWRWLRELDWIEVPSPIPSERSLVFIGNARDKDEAIDKVMEVTPK